MPGDLFERFALRKFDDGVVKFLAANEVNRRAVFQGFLRQHGHMGADKSNLDIGIGLFDLLTRRMSPGKPGVLVNSTRNS